MAQNIIEYTLSLQDKWSTTMRQVGISNNQQLETWAKVQKQVGAANQTMKNCGITIGSLKQRAAALRAEKEWIPANQIADIKRTNREVEKLESQIRKLETVKGSGIKSWFSNLKESVPIVKTLTHPLVMLGAAIYKVNSYIKDSEGAYIKQVENETKLAAVMKNTMGARRAEVNDILALASAQQKLGVIGDEVQLAGAQELATYLSKKESLEKLMPVMNDMLAQQYGLNATGEQAAQIAMMLGKVMDGQTGALSRYGYKFTEAQERILKHGNESQRAATLADVVRDAVGGVNEALANTPEGKLKQHANDMGDLQERVGQLYVQVKASLLLIFEWFRGILEDVIGWLEQNRDTILTIVNTIARVFKTAFTVVLTPIKLVIQALGWWKDKLQEGQPVVVILTGLVAAFGLALVAMEAPMMAMALWSGIVTAAKWLWTAAQWALNAALYANPIVWIITLIIGLIAVIGYVCYKTEGWGSLWKGVVGFMKHSFLAYIESIKLAWTTMVNGIMMGLDKIKLGWYKFKLSVGLGNKDANRQAIAEINRDIEARKDAISEGARKVAEHTQAAKDSLASIHMTWNKDKTISGMIEGMKQKFGITTPGVPGMEGSEGGDGSGDGGGAGSKAIESIATGGTRSTTINITIGSMVESIFYQGAFGENKDEFEKDLESALVRVLQMAHTAK
ncbi:MAG: hypothetical protein LUF04_16185 [Bacteroides sp.]|nr:hypothetical protein [Bacteroides sp.]